MLHVVYRSYGGENTKGRPPYYSKLISLLSFLRARAAVEGPSDIIYVNDGPIPADRLSIMQRTGEVVALEHAGNKGSMRTALRLPVRLGWAADDLIWFAEDDYLYREEALNALVSAARIFPQADYFGLYATIGPRLPDKSLPPAYAVTPAGWRDSEPVPIFGHAWRRGLSTTSTFGARVRVINQDRRMHEVAMLTGGPWDNATCFLYQGFLPYSLPALLDPIRQAQGLPRRARALGIAAARATLNGWQLVRRAPKRLLVAPEPSLAAHMDSEHMAYGTDWEQISRDSARWGADQGLAGNAALRA